MSSNKWLYLSASEVDGWRAGNFYVHAVPFCRLGWKKKGVASKRKLCNSKGKKERKKETTPLRTMSDCLFGGWRGWGLGAKDWEIVSFLCQKVSVENEKHRTGRNFSQTTIGNVMRNERAFDVYEVEREPLLTRRPSFFSMSPLPISIKEYKAKILSLAR